MRGVFAIALLLAAGCTDGRPGPAAPPPGPSAPLETGVPPAASLDSLARIVADAQGDGKGPFAAPTEEEQEQFARVIEDLARAVATSTTLTAAPPTATATALFGLPPAFARIADWNARA